jgi:thioredoxin reductase (NADPH)
LDPLKAGSWEILGEAECFMGQPDEGVADLRRPLSPLETSLPGVFAVGDIRAESVKRVASAVGEGSMVVQFVHKVLAE